MFNPIRSHLFVALLYDEKYVPSASIFDHVWNIAAYDLSFTSSFSAGLIPVVTSQKLLGDTGDFVMYTFVMVAVVTTVSGEVLAMASILLYDVYMTYIAPFE